MVDPKKLAAIDLVFLGPKIIIAEFALGVLLSLALAAFILLRFSAPLQIVLGLYFASLGINYLPMLIYAIHITKAGSARILLGDELDEPRKAMAKYRRQSVLLLVPLLIPIIALRRRDLVR
jgi:hypothetical protein